MKNLLALAVLTGSICTITPTLAGPLTTTAQIHSFDFSDINTSTSFSFTGFDASIGTLNSIHFEWTLDKTINNTVFNVNATSQNVGTPLALSAFSESTFQGTGAASALSATDTLTTPSFVGSVVNGFSTVGSTSAPNLSGFTCFSNDNSCGTGSSDLSAYIGGANLFGINFSNSTNQSGSVPTLVFTGNNGTTKGTVSISYDYTGSPSNPAVPEPAMLGLIGIAFASLGFRYKKS